MAYKLGDLVTLKSGSPCMTVVALEGTSFRCNWFSFSEGDYYCGTLFHGTFPAESLELFASDEDEEDVVETKKFGET